MDTKALQQLVKQAREDPKFFHALVFNPEEAITQIDYLDRRAKGALVALDPESLLGRVIGGLEWCDVTCTSSCGATCGGSCGYTTNLVGRPERIFPGRIGGVSGCDVTCTSSCGATCGDSCGYTTNLESPGSIVTRQR